MDTNSCADLSTEFSTNGGSVFQDSRTPIGRIRNCLSRPNWSEATQTVLRPRTGVALNVCGWLRVLYALVTLGNINPTWLTTPAQCLETGVPIMWHMWPWRLNLFNFRLRCASLMHCVYKKLSYRREAARRFVSLKFRYVTQDRSTSFEMTPTSRTCLSLDLLSFHHNYVCISHRFWYIRRQIMAWPLNLG